MATSRSKAVVDVELFHDIFQASPIGIVVETLDGQPLFVNAAFCSFLGFTEEELRNKHCVDFSPAEDAQKDWALFQQLRAGRTDGYQLEKRYFRKDGSLVWGRLSLSVLRHKPTPLVIAMVEDITEKKSAEEARFRHTALVESSQDAIISKDLDAIITSWNDGAKRMFGYTETEAVGQPITMLIPPELRDEENQIVEKLRAGDRIEHYETIRVTKSGVRRDVSLTICPIKDSSGNIVGFSKIAHDITARKTAEDALRESERKFRSVFRESGVGMVIVSPEGRYLAANRTFCDCLGYTEEELLERTVESLTFPEDWPAIRENLQEALVQDGGFQLLQKRCLHKSGRIVYTENSTSLIRGRDGSPQYFVAHVQDVTLRKKAEEALSGLTRRLIDAQEQERSRIARELHDDVTQQLALLAVELDQWGQGNFGDPHLRDRIRKTQRRIVEIGRDVQSVSHELHSSKLEYLGLVAAAKSFVKEISDANNIHIDFKEDGVPRILPNEVSLSLFRVLQQSLQNAVEHSGAKHVEVRLWEQSNELHLQVKDSGKGFNTLAAMQGAGLGLTSMRERVRLVNGTIAIDSKLRGGTTIHVRVPLGSGKVSERTIA